MQKPEQVTSSAANDLPRVDPPSGGPADEVMNSGPSIKRSDLSLQIPPRAQGLGSSRSGKNLLQPQDAVNANSSPRRFFRGLSFKRKVTVTDAEKSYLLNPDLKTAPSSPVLANLMSPWKKCPSLPVTPVSYASPSVSTPISARTYGERPKSRIGSVKPPVSRSLSVPGRNIVIVRSLSFASNKDDIETNTSDDQITPVPLEDEDKEIPEEDAVCRICFDACVEGNTLKMECCCKGALRLIHEECAIKWFTTKGNKNCDVCGHEVLNLPVTLIRMPSTTQSNQRSEHNQGSLDPLTISAWQDFVVLVLISSICYFFFLEQLMVDDMKTQAIVVAAPFALTLGLLASIFAILIAIREYIWSYAALEFVLVAIFLYLSYTFLNLKAVYAILLSSVLGFGISMSLNSLYIRYYTWRAQVSESSSPV